MIAFVLKSYTIEGGNYKNLDSSQSFTCSRRRVNVELTNTITTTSCILYERQRRVDIRKILSAFVKKRV